MIMHIGVLGGAFDPPTKGHEDVVEQALLEFDRVLLVPSINHPFGKKMTDLPTRLEMLRIFVQKWAGKSRTVEIYNIEQSISLTQGHNEPVYTYSALQKLTETLTTAETKVQLHFIVGPDNFQPEVWQKFYKHDEIEKNWPLFKVKERVPIRSSDVRAKLQSINTSKGKRYAILIPMVGESIARYIITHQLYGIYF